MAEFNIPPVSPLIGSTITNMIRSLRLGRVEPRYFPKVVTSTLIVLLLTPLHFYERWMDRSISKKNHTKRPPIFIIGHWRSGTTLLHNLMTQDPNAGFISTYQAVFPNNVFSNGLFKRPMQWIMPKSRPSDNMVLGANLPQEDEMALSNMTPLSFYGFFYYPKKNRELFHKVVTFKTAKPQEVSEWKREYRKLVQKASHISKTAHLVLKNPLNTARIPTLLDMYPESRLLHIHRNPILVYLSAKKFFENLLPTVQLNFCNEEEIRHIVLENYELLYREFLRQKDAVGKDQLLEIRFEDLEERPVDTLRHIYEKSNLDFNPAINPIKTYLSRHKNYKKNKHCIGQKELDEVKEKWGFFMKEYDYDIPKSVELIN
jgi:hypothetical protein